MSGFGMTERASLTPTFSSRTESHPPFPLPLWIDVSTASHAAHTATSATNEVPQSDDSPTDDVPPLFKHLGAAMNPGVLTVLEFDESLWDQVLSFADTVVPYDREGNRVWLTNRRQFTATGRIRRHYAALRQDGQMVAYGSIEQQPDAAVYRLFIVPGASGLWDTAAQALFLRLAEDLAELGATLVWMREYARDVELICFAQEHGFVEVEALDLPGPTGSLRIIRLEKRLGSAVEAPGWRMA